MAALTKDQWYQKLKGWVPGWFFETEQYNAAHFNALALLLANADSEMRKFVDDTFITRATDLTLDQHGYERGIIRYVGESDADYSERIRNMANVLTFNSIILLTNTFLLTGSANVIEHELDGFFFDRDSFITRQVVFSDIHYNVFSVVVRNQGITDAAATALNTIAKTINNSKALGTLYKLIETDL